MSKIQVLLKERIHANIQAHSQAKKEFNVFQSNDYKRVRLIELSKIKPNTAQPRLIFDEDALAELVQSIKDIGLISPISVRPAGEHYEIVAGERRFRAYQKLGKTHIECFIIHVNDAHNALMALAENLNRAELTDYEVAKAVIAFKAYFPSKTDYAKSLGISRQKLYKLLAYESLSERTRASLDHSPAILSADTAEKLVALQKEYPIDDDALITLLEKIQSNELKQNQFISSLKNICASCPNSDTSPKTITTTQHLMRADGKIIGKLQQNHQKMTLKLQTCYLSEEQKQAVNNLLALLS